MGGILIWRILVAVGVVLVGAGCRGVGRYGILWGVGVVGGGTGRTAVRPYGGLLRGVGMWAVTGFCWGECVGGTDRAHGCAPLRGFGGGA